MRAITKTIANADLIDSMNLLLRDLGKIEFHSIDDSQHVIRFDSLFTDPDKPPPDTGQLVASRLFEDKRINEFLGKRGINGVSVRPSYVVYYTPPINPHYDHEKSVHSQINDAVEKLHALCTGVRKVAEGWGEIYFEADEKKADKDPSKLAEKINDVLVTHTVFSEAIKAQELKTIHLEYVSKKKLQSHFIRPSLRT